MIPPVIQAAECLNSKKLHRTGMHQFREARPQSAINYLLSSVATLTIETRIAWYRKLAFVLRFCTSTRQPTTHPF